MAWAYGKPVVLFSQAIEDVNSLVLGLSDFVLARDYCELPDLISSQQGRLQDYRRPLPNSISQGEVLWQKIQAIPKETPDRDAALADIIETLDSAFR